MASFSNVFSFLFFTTLLSSLQINARDSQFFSKVAHANNGEETQLLNKEETVSKAEQEPVFVPETDNSYGLYGHESRSPNSAPEEEPAPGDKLILRPYSIASARTSTQEFEFYISQVKSGQLTPRLFALEPGDRVHVSTRIVGVFTLADTPHDADIVMVATGTGLAPYISFLRSHVAERPQSKMAIIHGAAYPWDLGYYSELTFLAQTFANFYYLPTLTHADQTWTGYRYWIEQMLD